MPDQLSRKECFKVRDFIVANSTDGVCNKTDDELKMELEKMLGTEIPGVSVGCIRREIGLKPKRKSYEFSILRNEKVKRSSRLDEMNRKLDEILSRLPERVG